MTNLIRILKTTFCLLISLLISIPLKSENIYKVEFYENKIKLIFNENWYFTRISIPSVSDKIWGNNCRYNAAIIEFNGKKHIISCSDKQSYMELNLPTDSIKEITLTPLSFSETSSNNSNPAETRSPIFTATQEKTKFIEDKLLNISQNELNKITQNNCFSCHTAIPLAMAINTARRKGYNIPLENGEKLLNKIKNIQNRDGSFYFNNHPSYGKITPTLVAGFIAATLADFAPDAFLSVANNISSYINNYFHIYPESKSDFLYEPLFNSTTTSILFESVFQQIYYIKSHTPNEEIQNRLKQLNQETVSLKNLDIKSKLILYSGIPYSYQISSNEKDTIIKELTDFYKNETNSKPLSLKVLCMLILQRISPDLERVKQEGITQLSTMKDTKDSDIWKCIEEMLYNTPKYLNGCYDENK